MTRSLVLVGAGEFADVAQAYFDCDSDFRVVGFAVDTQHRRASSHNGLPLVDFEGLEDHFDPANHACFVAIGAAQSNRIRRDRLRSILARGYLAASFVSPHAIVHASAQIGDHVFVADGVIVEPLASIGDNVTVWSGAIIGHLANIGAHSFVSLGSLIGAATSVGEGSFVDIGAIVPHHRTLSPETRWSNDGCGSP